MQKMCIKCREVKEESEFRFKNKSNPKYLRSHCIPCAREYDRKRWKERTPALKKQTRKLAKERIDAKFEKLALYLLSKPCVDCGENDIRCLDFDHLMNKNYDISVAMQKKNWEVICEEIVKCEVRCANCHRKITNFRANTRKQQLFDKYQRDAELKVEDVRIN